MEISREPKQACHACKEPIQKDASKCAHCGSEQERFTWSSIGLAGGAALSVISLCTLAGGTAWSWIEAKQASLIGAVAQVDQTGVYFSLSNTGNRAATIMQGSVKGKFAEGSCKGIAEFEDTLQTASIFSVIEPGKESGY